MFTLAQLKNGELKGLTRLRLSEGLRAFPKEIFDLADTLEILDLSDNQLDALPKDLPRLKHLRVIFCSNNRFTELPSVLGQCQNLTMVGFKANQISHVPPDALPAKLRWLILTDNCIEELPPNLSHSYDLQKLMLAGNQLKDLPRQLHLCKHLELIRCSSNQLQEFPEVLMQLPRLSWLAFADNPFCLSSSHTSIQDKSLAIYDWSVVKVGGLIGQGASGLVFQAQLPRHFNHAPLAIKVFKASMTSDGSPDTEMQSILCAGRHANLIPVLGQVNHHPEGLKVLLMQQLSSEFHALAGPPSLRSCTRDEYADGSILELEQVQMYAKGLAKVLQHLHQRRVMHGDVYAHNLLVHYNGECFLSDFGAASFYHDLPNAIGLKLESMELKAFGILLQECLAIVRQQYREVASYFYLQALSKKCFNPLEEGEFSFQELCDNLDNC